MGNSETKGERQVETHGKSDVEATRMPTRVS